MIEFLIKQGDVIDEPSNLLLLKYAQSLYGADKAVAKRLISAGVCKESDLRLHPGESTIIDTEGAIAPSRVMFLGTMPLRSFSYKEMEEFSQKAIEKIADSGMPVGVLTTTVHGTGYGLDGGESLQRLVRGFLKGLSDQNLHTIQKIVFLTLDAREHRMLSDTLDSLLLDAAKLEKPISAKQPTPPNRQQKPTLIDVTEATPKRRVFVAMPFSEEYQNVYEYGIYPAVRNSGLICERVDEAHFTGDVLTRIKGGIEAADLVIADLSEARPNVYLEVGYAWAKNIPVIIVAKKGETLHFDVGGHRCLFYGAFRKFAEELEGLIRGISGK